MLIDTDYIMNNSFFVGLYPDIGEDQIGYMLNSFSQFLKAK